MICFLKLNCIMFSAPLKNIFFIFRFPDVDENDEMNPQHFPSFEQSFTNVFKEMEHAMEEMARTFGSIDIEIDQGWNNSQTPSLRDQMLKPGYSNHDEVHDRKKEDKDLDAALIPKENFEKLFNGRRSMYPNGLHSSHSSRTSVTIRNGAVTEQKEESDMEGCQRKITTHQFEGKKYVVEKWHCPGGEESIIEHFENLTHEEMPDFLKKFQQR